MSELLERLAAALSGRYRLERELGAGGMATVYLAQDLKHGRRVAVKVFRPELAAALGTERFFREIKITANLNHPHILPLLDSGTAVGRYGGRAVDGPGEFLYYVMPYVEGESLRHRLNREKQLPVDEALKITSQVAGALSYAHSHDIVHRDIKPENILFQADEVVVADFGIALAVDSAGGTRLTETGFSLGTPAYMSPEQVSGEQEIDGRSDIYSLACVLYEMLAGDPPFVASSPRAVLAKHVTDPAPPITTVRSSVPQAVTIAIAKALGKVPADRFESAMTFSEALSAKEVEAEQHKKSIVVLPFENLSPDPDQEYFSDGLTEEVISDLSKVHALEVISRSSAMTFKGSNKKIPEIARELNVRYVLEGSVRRAGNNLRITAQLIDAERDVHLWADKYSGTLDDVFDMQEKVSRAIVEALKVTLGPAEQRRMAERPVDNAAAYECYLRAKAGSFDFSEESVQRAIEHLRHGLKLIGDNALLYAGMAFAYSQLVNIGAQQEEGLARAHQCIEKALAIDPGCAEVFAVLAWIDCLEGDNRSTVRHSKRALAIDRNHTLALATLAAAYIYTGKLSAALPVCDRLKQVDPIAFQTYWTQGALAFYAGRFDHAVRWWRELSERYPTAAYSAYAYATALIYNGNSDTALAILDQNAVAHPDNAQVKVGLVLKHSVLRDKGGALGEMSPDFVKTCSRDYENAHHLAGAFALLGETNEALKWLETAVDLGFINYPMLAEHDPLLESIRGEERFKQLIVRVKKEWEEFEV